MFEPDYATGHIDMHQGDTGVFRVKSRRRSGSDFTEYDRMLFTVRHGSDVIMQRIYRLDDDGIGNGKAIIQFHNNDTDEWEPGDYPYEVRLLINPTWDGDPEDPIPSGNCTNGLTASRHPNEGDCVRTKVQASITVHEVYGRV